MTDPLLRAIDVRPAGTWREAASDVVVLDYDDRHRRRRVMDGVRGTRFLLDLPATIALRGGDALCLEDGRLIEVVAAPEPLVEVRAQPAALTRIAWHLGNRHLAVQLVGPGIRLRRDHVIEAMIEGLGGRLRTIEAPFDPEGGAYASHSHGTPMTDSHPHHDDGPHHGHSAHHHRHG